MTQPVAVTYSKLNKFGEQAACILYGSYYKHSPAATEFLNLVELVNILKLNNFYCHYSCMFHRQQWPVCMTCAVYNTGKLKPFNTTHMCMFGLAFLELYTQTQFHIPEKLATSLYSLTVPLHPPLPRFYWYCVIMHFPVCLGMCIATVTYSQLGSSG